MTRAIRYHASLTAALRSAKWTRPRRPGNRRRKLMQTGLDRLPSLARVLARLKSSRVGVLAHPASVDRRLSHISDVLVEVGVKPSLFFGPEHGYGGEAQ